MDPIALNDLIKALVRVMKTQKAVAKALGISRQRFHYWLHYARKVPYEYVLAMQSLLQKQFAAQLPPADNGPPGEETAETSSKPAGTRWLNLSLLQHAPLLSAERMFRLPLRLTFIGLLAACNGRGCFQWHLPWLKQHVLPYFPVDLCRLRDAFHYAGLIRPEAGTGGQVWRIQSLGQFVREFTPAPESSDPNPSAKPTEHPSTQQTSSQS